MKDGHFIVAKLCKIKVNEFSVGFGKCLFNKNIKGTKYSLRLIPLGGFVSMEGEETPSKEEGSFSEASFLKKLAVVLAGPIVNIIFGLGVYFILISIMYNIQVALPATGNFIQALYDSVKNMITGGVSPDDLAGPVGIMAVVSQTSGIADFVYLLAVISLSLGITNLLPIPPLDRRQNFNIYNRTLKKKTTKRRNIIKITNVRIYVHNRIITICNV